MSSIADAVNAPIADDGQQFHILEMQDIGLICREILKDRIDKAKRDAEMLQLTPVESFRCISEIRQRDVALAEFSLYVQTVSGIDRILLASLVKGGIKDVDAKAAIAKIRPGRRLELAMEVSGVFTKPEPPKQQGAK